MKFQKLLNTFHNLIKILQNFWNLQTFTNSSVLYKNIDRHQYQDGIVKQHQTLHKTVLQQNCSIDQWCSTFWYCRPGEWGGLVCRLDQFLHTKPWVLAPPTPTAECQDRVLGPGTTPFHICAPGLVPRGLELPPPAFAHWDWILGFWCCPFPASYVLGLDPEACHCPCLPLHSELGT